ncbi:hypothetical protein AB0O90_17295 [Microbacterium testaceum]|uniref:hypothetical protein n=1 Tax=Microbacterium testaceum TaxID=2033 RepID=UPI0034181DFE
MPVDSNQQFLIRVGVSLLSARRFFDNGHPEHARLALIVLDGAAELLLRRLLAENEMSFRLGQIMFRQNEEAVTLGIERPHEVHVMTFPSDAIGDGRFSPVYLSGTQRRRLDSYFGPTVDVAVFFGSLGRDEGRALKHLHEYRNGAHHRNVVNLPTVRVLVQLQMTVIASLLRSMPTGPIHRLYPPIDWSEAREVLGLPENSPVSYLAFADALQEGIEQTAAEITSSFGGNLAERITQVTRRVEQIQSDMATPGVTFEMWFGLVQTPEPWPVGEALRFLDPPVTTGTLASWAQEVVTAEPSESALQTFARLVAIDEQLVGLEDSIEKVERQVDATVQLMIDEMRGK